MTKIYNWCLHVSDRGLRDWAPLCIALVLLFVSPANAMQATEPQQNVLAIFAGRSDLSSNILVDREIRSILVNQLDVRLDFRSEYINVMPLPVESFPAFREYLRKKYAGIRFDIIVAVAEDAALFVRDNAAEVFPGVPIVLFGGGKVFEKWGQGPPVTGVLEPKLEDHIQEAVKFICTLQPDLREIVLVSGAAPQDRWREAIAREKLGLSDGDIRFTYLAGLEFEELRRRLRTLSRKSAIFFLTFNEDGAGKEFVTSDALNQITPSASAPIYSLSGARVGSGIVASLLTDQETMAEETAEIVLRLLRNDQLKNIPIRRSQRASIVDWRQLRRWNIHEDSLPPGAVVRYRQPSLWSLYKWHLTGIFLLCSLEAAMIVALMIHRGRRRRAEVAAVRSQELLQATIDALQARVALLDENANIVAVNEPWRRFADANSYFGADSGVGRNYLEICESSLAQVGGREVSEGIRALISGARESFCFVYECSDGANESWFQLRANRFISQGMLRLALAHENVTEIKRAHIAMQEFNSMLLRAQDEERRRIARDLHDVTAQNLAVIKADLTQVQKLSSNMDTRAKEALTEVMFLSDQVINELRTVSYLLHPPLLDEAGLVPAIRWYARGFTLRSGIRVEVRVTEEVGRLQSDMEAALFRVVQEALTNIHRHSGSQIAVLSLFKEKGDVIVRIQDYGRGMPEFRPDNLGTVPFPGVGIPGMRQRLNQLGGQLEIESNLHGTTVTGRAPILEEHVASYSSRR